MKMTHPHIQLRAGLLACIVALLAGFSLSASARAAGPIETAVYDIPNDPLAFKRVHDAGATAVRIVADWNEMAGVADRSVLGDASDPNNPHYYWTWVDSQVRLAKANKLEPIIVVMNAPPWAERGRPSSYDPGTLGVDAGELGQWATALAKHYDGNHGIGRVRYFEAWNEPNNFRFLNPQWDGSKWPPSKSPAVEIYRRMVNAFASGVYSANSSNRVIAGALAPFTGNPNLPLSPPLPFMRSLLCLTSRNKPIAGCEPIQFDIWAHQPYTSGNPTHSANSPNDVSLGDLPVMRRVLQAGVKSGKVISEAPVRFWVTEWSWDTNPPDDTAVPLKLHKRWVAESLYRMWKNGVSLGTWFRLRDDVNPTVPNAGLYQSGLYFTCAGGLSCDKPKPSLEAFRFPFVAFRQGGSVLIWGRLPWSKRGTANVEQKVGGRWRRLARMRTNKYGIFTKKIKTGAKGDFRARLGREASVPFSLKVPPDMLVNPFGGEPSGGGRGF